MPSYLVAGSKSDERIQAIKNVIKKSGFDTRLDNHPDLIFIDSEKSIGINQIRQLKNKFSLKPFQAQFKIAIFPQAEKLTVPAQNALLKTLEEPPQDYLIFLSAPSKNQLLTTIISRCHVIQLQEKTQISVDKESLSISLSFLESILTSSLGMRISLAEETAKQGREEAIQFCQKLLFALRFLLFKKLNLKTTPSLKPPQNLSRLKILYILKMLSWTQKTSLYLAKNVNPKLALESLFLSLPRISDKI